MSLQRVDLGEFRKVSDVPSSDGTARCSQRPYAYETRKARIFRCTSVRQFEAITHSRLRFPYSRALSTVSVGE